MPKTSTKMPKTKTIQPVEIKIPAQTDYVGVIRLAVSGIAARLNFSVEQIEDIKVAVTEACANAVQYAYENEKEPELKHIDIICKPQAGKLEVIIKDYGIGFDPDNPPVPKEKVKHTHLGLGITFMKTLMDSVEITSKKNKGTVVKLIKKTTSS
jgi:serine/threonine-protein kinase RsbW